MTERLIIPLPLWGAHLLLRQHSPHWSHSSHSCCRLAPPSSPSRTRWWLLRVPQAPPHQAVGSRVLQQHHRDGLRTLEMVGTSRKPLKDALRRWKPETSHGTTKLARRFFRPMAVPAAWSQNGFLEEGTQKSSGWKNLHDNEATTLQRKKNAKRWMNQMCQKTF